MKPLDHYQIPHDPNAEHQLHWQPGSHGKGLVSPEGIVHHWSVDRQDGQPSHRQYMQGAPSFGYDPYTTQPGRDDNHPFWIKPDGELSMLNQGDDAVDHILSIDPRIAPPSEKGAWHFGDVQQQNRIINGQGPPEIISPFPDATPLQIKAYDYNARRPFIYNAAEHKVYVGRTGTHHYDVVMQHPALQGQRGGYYEGAVMKGSPELPDSAHWFHAAPDNNEEVLDAIAARHGVPAEHYKSGGEWRFAAAPTADELVKLLGVDAIANPRPLPIDPDAEARRRQMQEDPIGFEQRNDWDRPGDVQHGNENIQWVPIDELKRFMEYDRRPGAEHSVSSPERWNALGEHIKNNGFKNPVWIDYNPDSGMAHMSEGNHRTQIAIDHGIPAMPVRVYRSQRSSPTQIPLHAQPQPEWEDRYDPTGYRWPQYPLPEHIGLTSVPQPGSLTSKTAAQYMYHVAPSHLRDKIQQEGLRGHEGYDKVESPWQQNVGQPPGNYLYDSLPEAKVYIAERSAKENTRARGMYPGDAYDPAHDYGSGWDIHRVNVSGLPLSTDPEDYLVQKSRDPSFKPHTPDSLDWFYEHKRAPNMDTTGSNRWVSPNHVEPHRLETYEHVSPKQITDQWADQQYKDAQDDTYPAEVAILHPRHILPKGVVPPELREIWSGWQFT